MTITSITKAFNSLKDPRKIQTPPHSLLNIITISICGVICGADNFVTIAQFGQSKQKWFESFLDMPNGIPSHDTFNDVMNRLNPTDFAECFTQWISGLAGAKDDIIALDGKVMRGTLDKINGGKATWLVNAWSVANNLCFGQQEVETKSNEITAIPKLLAILDIEGATVTTDAMGTQTKIADLIVRKKGHYVMGLKGNQGNLNDDITLFLDDLMDNKVTAYTCEKHVDVHGDHGRIETRTTLFTTDIQWLKERHPKWKTINGVAVVETEKQEGGKVTTDRRYFITSHRHKSAEAIGKIIRNHWHVENKLHWQLDVSFDEDSCRLRSGHAAANFSLLNKIALNLLKNEKSVKIGVKSKRLKAGWDEGYMMKVLTVGLK